MGVPKFYRWISERYPCLSEVVREYQIPEFDNLYLDMNGIIHNCSHPNDDDVHFRLSEEQVFQDIFRYLEFLFRMIKPRKIFFLAVDGVAPRAKMNQQRGRRFRSAKEAEKREEEAKKRGEILPPEKRFDSNCITPGTEFMDRLHQALKWFLVQKISTDEMWQNVRVILSGHETPGEGEHKIMDFIRYQKSQPDYDPNTRHCLYGLDADLIVLGLCSHEPHFSLLREEVKFLKYKSNNKQKSFRSVNPDVITFHLLHLSLLRNYLDHEFSALQTKLPFGYNIENIIDDWILMGFLVGNDFIPHIPHFHINKNSLSELYRVYIEVMPTLDGYLNENGTLNLVRFEKFLRKVAEIDEENFLQTYADLRYFDAKKTPSVPKKHLKKFYEMQEGDEEMSVSERFAALETCEEVGYNETVTPIPSEEEDSESPESEASDTFDEEFTLHKQRYYEEKLELEKVDAEALHEQAIGYIRAIQWNLHYYYNGCVSWSWFYPHHYAPYISDVKNFASADISFEMGKPFKPFEQLLAVLPAASKDLLPHAYQRLLTDANSPIIQHYPENFELDMNEKQQDWEAVVKISFIDEKQLLKVADECSLLFSSKEKERNVHRPHVEFTYSEERKPVYKSPLSFLRDIEINQANVNEIDIDLYRISQSEVRHGLARGVKLDLLFPGFPTLHFIEHDHHLKAEKVRVFESFSRGENMILTVKNKDPGDILQLAHECLGKSVFINWPHLLEAKVEEVCDFTFVYSLDPDSKQVKQSKLDEKRMKDFAGHTKNFTLHYREKKGIDIGATDVVLVTYPITGRKYIPSTFGSVSFEKQWSTTAAYAPLQTVVRDISVYDASFMRYTTVDQIYPVGSKCFVLAPSYYGQVAIVQDKPSSSGNIKVTISVTEEPDLSEVVEMETSVIKDNYHPNFNIAQRVGLSGHVLSRLTGTILVESGASRANIGLNLRFNSRGMEIPGFSRKIDDLWYLSNKVAEIAQEYNELFPEVIHCLASGPTRDVFTVKDIFPGENGPMRLKELLHWLKSLPCYGASKQKIGAEILDDCVVRYIEKLLNTFWTMADEPKEISLTLKPHLLYRSLPFCGYFMPDPKAKFNLYDRVVNVRDGISVPFGLKGVIIGKHVDEDREVNTVYDVLFDEEFPGGVALRCSPGRGYKMSAANLINISFGRTKSLKQKQSKNACFEALQPQVKAPKPSENQKSNRRNDQENGKRNGKDGREFAVAYSNGQHVSNGKESKSTPGKQANFAAAVAPAPVTHKQRPVVLQNPGRNGQHPRQQQQQMRVHTNSGGQKILSDLLHTPDAKKNERKKILVPEPKESHSLSTPPQFIPTQVSRQQNSVNSHRKVTPNKQKSPPANNVVMNRTPNVQQQSTPPHNMMTLERLEEELLRSSTTPASAAADRPTDSKSSTKKRVAINF